MEKGTEKFIIRAAHFSRLLLSSFAIYKKDAKPLRLAMQSPMLFECFHFKESGIIHFFHSLPATPR